MDQTCDNPKIDCEKVKPQLEEQDNTPVDPLITKTIDAIYSEFLKVGVQRNVRKKLIHPFLNHALSIFGPFLSVIASLMTFLIFLMLLIIIILVGWILRSKDMAHMCNKGMEAAEKIIQKSPVLLSI
ncbi:MAG: hypothetical protein EOP45_08340 [Sphingobacteriaceae bacterium]|nr:MAG: hypothetical protein EOP45_08340 [Sphingobacteriaceae bacterium]